MSASQASQGPIKGILKNPSTKRTFSESEDPEQKSGGATGAKRKKTQSWDESSILATGHSSHKGFDVMKTKESSAPELSVQDGGEDNAYCGETKDPSRAITIDILAKKFADITISKPNLKMREPESYGEHASKIFPSDEEKRRQFELRRKLNSNEGLNIKFARQLIAREFQCEGLEDVNEQRLEESHTVQTCRTTRCRTGEVMSCKSRNTMCQKYLSMLQRFFQ